MNVPTEHMFFLSAALFALGVLGFLVRRNVIVTLMCVELMLNAANLAFLAASRMHSTGGDAPVLDVQGPVFAIFVITVAAAEAAVGLALVIAMYRLKQTVDTDAASEMKG
jgi:NADH-quinone oxidoreductase subunit K